MLATADREPYFYSVTRGGVLGAQRLNGLPPRAPWPCARHRYRSTGGGTAALLRPPLAAPFLSTLSALTSVSPQTPLTLSCGELSLEVNKLCPPLPAAAHVVTRSAQPHVADR